MGSDRTTDAPLLVYGTNAVLELLKSGEPLTRLHVGPGPREAEVLAAARRRGVAVVLTERRELERLAGSPQHQGVVAIAPPFRYVTLDRLLGNAPSSALVIDGVQDPRNLGAILRTARAAGVGSIVMPRDRSVGVTSVVAAASAGLLFGLAVARVPNLVRGMGALREGGFWLVGLVAQGGTNLYAFDPPERTALVVGGEGQGLRALVARTCDHRVSIPMAPGVDSLNVAVATGVALYELSVRRGGS